MHPVTVESAVGLLLVSGVASLGLLLKRKSRSRRFGSSSSLLSASDVASSFVAASLLLGQRATPGSRDDCDFTGVSLQYASFIVPFAHAFGSLVSLSLNSPRPRGLGARRPATLGAIASQWLVPAVFSGFLHLGEYRRPEMPGSDLACTLAANFPFESCSPRDAAQLLLSEDHLLRINSSAVDDVVDKVYELVRAFALEDPVNHSMTNQQTESDLMIQPRFDNMTFDEEEVEVSRCSRNRCIVSPQFLRVHLSLLLAFVYLAPILVLGMVLAASQHKCKEIGEKLANESDLEAEAKHALVCENEATRGFLKLLGISGFLAVGLWTPFFLQVLSKVFFCSSAPAWLLELAFFASVLATVLRNAVGIGALKIEDAAQPALETTSKRNSVHPDN